MYPWIFKEYIVNTIILKQGSALRWNHVESLAKQNKNSFLTSCYHLKVNKQQLAYKMLNNISTNVRVIVAASRELSSGIMTF